MSKKAQLRTTREGTVINITSKKQEVDVGTALTRVVERIEEDNDFKYQHSSNIKLKYIVELLRGHFPDENFHYHFETSELRPDGGILYIETKDGNLLPILIAEVKNQGTNDLREQEGKPKQSKGNAIERLGKNVIGLRTMLLSESIFPFVCFGYGCDFAPDSSILDRVTTISMFGNLNETHLHNTTNNLFNRGSFYFREAAWSVDEMYDIMFDIAGRSILYYRSKYGDAYFARKLS